MQLLIYLFIQSFIYSPTSAVGVGNNLRGCLSGHCDSPHAAPRSAAVCVSPLHTSPSILSANVTLLSAFTVPPCRLSNTLHVPSPLVMTKEKKDTTTRISERETSLLRYETKGSARGQKDANRSHEHTNQRLIKNACAHGGSTTLHCI